MISKTEKFTKRKEGSTKNKMEINTSTKKARMANTMNKIRTKISFQKTDF